MTTPREDAIATRDAGGGTMSGPWITTCLHGVDLRLTPRCYLCKPVAIEAEARRAALDEAIAAVWGLLPMRDDPEAHVDYALRVVIDALTRLRDGASPDSPEVR